MLYCTWTEAKWREMEFLVTHDTWQPHFTAVLKLRKWRCVWSSKSHQTESATWWIDLSSVLTVPELVLPCGNADSSLESCFSRMVHEVRSGSMWHRLIMGLIDRWYLDFENVSFLSVGYNFTSVNVTCFWAKQDI